MLLLTNTDTVKEKALGANVINSVSPNQLMVSYSDTADIMSETSPVFDQVLFCDPGSDISINSCSSESSDGDLCPQNQQPTVTCYSELILLSLY